MIFVFLLPHSIQLDFAAYAHKKMYVMQQNEKYIEVIPHSNKDWQ